MFRPELVIRQSTASSPVDLELAPRQRPLERATMGPSPQERGA
jgi:hypothetical protein